MFKHEQSQCRLRNSDYRTRQEGRERRCAFVDPVGPFLHGRQSTWTAIRSFRFSGRSLVRSDTGRHGRQTVDIDSHGIYRTPPRARASLGRQLNDQLPLQEGRADQEDYQQWPPALNVSYYLSVAFPALADTCPAS